MTQDFKENDRVAVLVGYTPDKIPVYNAGTVFSVAPGETITIIGVRMDNGWTYFRMSQYVSRLCDRAVAPTRQDVLQALQGDSARAANADEFETYMLRLLADQERTKGGVAG